MVGGSACGWVGIIFVLAFIFSPAFANISACREEKDCFQVPNEEFLQLDQSNIMREVSYQPPLECIGPFALGVLSWGGNPAGAGISFVQYWAEVVQELILHPEYANDTRKLLGPCVDTVRRESLKYAVASYIRDDLETFAASSQAIKVKFSPDENLEDWPTINDKLSQLENSISESDAKAEALDGSIKRFKEFTSRGMGECANAIESFFGTILKQTKDKAISGLNSLAKGDGKK